MQFQEWPKWVNGKIVQNAAEEAALTPKTKEPKSVNEDQSGDFTRGTWVETSHGEGETTPIRRGPGRPPTVK